MIGQSTVTLTITNVTFERMNSGKGGEQTKPCLHFQERDKMMVLNKTNATAIAKEAGPETNDWPGWKVTLNAPMIDAFGKQTRSIRIVRVQPPDLAPKSRGNGNAASATPPADGVMRQYSDGEFVHSNLNAAYDAYCAANGGHAPGNVAQLVEWSKSNS
jgi:hypothetical protein